MSHKKKNFDVPEIILPITPMLDMTFQLMFFFLVNFNPSSVKEGQLDMSLPAKSDNAAKDASQINPSSESHKEEMDDKAVVTISIRGSKQDSDRGKISYLTINTDNGADEEIKGTEDDRKAILKEKLDKSKPADSLDKEGNKKIPTVRVAADSDVRISEVITIVDVCTKAGFQVSFQKPPNLGTGS